MSPLMILDPLDQLLVSTVVPFSLTVNPCFYIRHKPAEYVINTSLFAIALARHDTCSYG